VTAEPGPPPGPAPLPVPAPPAAPRGRRRRWLITLAVVVVVLAAGLTAFLLTRPSGLDEAVPCGTAYCFPGSDQATVGRQLTAAGYNCGTRNATTLCVGPAATSIQLTGPLGRISELSAFATDPTADGALRQEDDALGRVLPVLLPGADDLRKTVTDWVAGQAGQPGTGALRVPVRGGFTLNCYGHPAGSRKTLTAVGILAVHP
jgi:hypothetical protein